jgi:hypothetical protein
MRLRIVSAVMAAAAVTLLLAAPAPAASFRPCGKVSLGFTSAKVQGRSMSCSAARGLFKAWRRAVERVSKNRPAPARISVGAFVCRFGGTELILTLNCTGADGVQAMRARWGG